MPSVDYDAMRAGFERRKEPLTFRLCGRIFMTKPSPSMGDTLDLMDAPEPLPNNEAQAARACVKFIKSMLSTDAEREEFDAALRELPVEEGYPLVTRITTDLVKAYTFRPTEPSGSFSNGQAGIGLKSNPEPGGWVPRER